MPAATRTKKAKKHAGGRPKKSLHELKQAGTYRAHRHAPKAQAKTVKRRRVASANVPSAGQIRKYCKTCIPGYDPWTTANGYKWNPNAAVRVVEFFHKELRHCKGPKARTPFELEPWEIAVVANLYGWQSKTNPGVNRYHHALVYVPRKNGKTPLAAGILLYQLFHGGDIGAEIYGAAKEYKQACLVWQHAYGFVLQNEELKKRCQNGKGLYKGQSRAIVLGEEDLFSAYKPICADDDAAQGFNANAVVLDELHTQPDDKLINALETSLSGRANPLFVAITTADYDRPASPCNDMRQYAIQVRDGLIPDQRFLPVIFEADKDDDWQDPAVWYKANPNLGISKRLDYMEAQCEKAKRSPAKLNAFLRFDLNVITSNETRWLNRGDWDACAADYKPEHLAEMECFGGFDLASTIDMTAFVLMAKDDDDIFWLYPWYWVPEGQVEREREERKGHYWRWVQDGYLNSTPGNMADYGWIRKDVSTIAGSVPFHWIGFDPWNARQFEGQLEEDGFEIVEYRQGYKTLSTPTKYLEGLVTSKRLRHPNHPILNWNIDNVFVQSDENENMRPIKNPKQGTEGKIDGVMATLMALCELLRNSTGVVAASIDWV